jgi:NAD(P)H dehydrogenase (quinone)
MIAVLGATGTIGTHVAAGLAARGAAALALTRDPDRPGLGLPAVAAELRDPASLRAGLEGAEQLFLLTPHGPDQDLLEANAVDAANAAGVHRIVKIGGGAPTLGPNGASSTAVAHWRSERRIEESGLRFGFLRSSFLMQNVLTLRPVAGLLPAPMGDAPIAMVDARDVAECAVTLLLDREAADQAWHLTGPRGVTFKDVATRLGARYVNVPPRLAAKALRRRGASAFEVDHAIRMAAYFASGADAAPTGAVQAITGRPPRTFDDFLSTRQATRGS